MQVCAKNDNLKGNTERSHHFLDMYVPTSNDFVYKRWLQTLLSVMSSSRYLSQQYASEAFPPADSLDKLRGIVQGREERGSSF